MEFAFAKQSDPELIRIISRPGTFVAIGYWMTLEKVLVPGTLPSTSVLGRIEPTITLTKEITTCNGRLIII